MKAILMSIRPEWVAKILNGEKTIEIRKKFPKDYVGWVYVYCTKDRPYLTRGVRGDVYPSCVSSQGIVPHHLNSRVVARFWCDRVEEHRPFFHWCIEKETCLTRDDVLDYLDSKDKSVGNPKRQGKVYAIHITKLEIFDKPKEIKDFSVYSHSIIGTNIQGETTSFKILKPLSCAPQSWCYIYE